MNLHIQLVNNFTSLSKKCFNNVALEKLGGGTFPSMLRWRQIKDCTATYPIRALRENLQERIVLWQKSKDDLIFHFLSQKAMSPSPSAPPASAGGLGLHPLASPETSPSPSAPLASAGSLGLQPPASPRPKPPKVKHLRLFPKSLLFFPPKMLCRPRGNQ